MVEVSNPKPEENVDRLQFTNKPAIDTFDKVVFASPVWAFSLSGVMKAYLAGLPSLKGNKTSLFGTLHLPLPWMGGNETIRQMTKLCKERGGEVLFHAFVSWNEKQRERDLALDA